MGLFGLGRPNVEKMKAKWDVKGLIKALSHKDSEIRDEAVEALGKIGEPAVEPLVKVLKGKRKLNRESTAETLGKIGEPAVEPLVRILKEKSKLVRESAVEALGKIGEPAVEPLVKTLKGNNKMARERVCAAEALGQMGEPAVIHLTKALKDEKRLVRECAADTLGGIGWKPQNSTEEAYYLIAKMEWNQLMKLGEPAVEPLITALKYERVKSDATEVLIKIGELAVEPLIGALKDKDPHVREYAAEVLGEIGDKRAVEPLIKAIKYKTAKYKCVKSDATEALIKIGELAVEPLIGVLEDKDPDVREYAVMALREIGDKKAVKPLIKALKDKNENVREYAVMALGELRDKRAVRPLIKALKDKDEDVREYAEKALEELSDFFIEALKDKDEDVREYAEKALEELSEFFIEESTSDPSKALSILINKALKKLPVLSLEKFREEYSSFRNSWGDLPLVEGSEEEIKKVILKNAKKISKRDDFKVFTVKLYLADSGYKDREVAAFEAWIEGTGWLAMLWKTENEIHAFGRPELLFD